MRRFELAAGREASRQSQTQSLQRAQKRKTGTREPGKASVAARRIESPAEAKRSEVKLKFEYSTQLKKNTAEMRTARQMLLI